ncbi:MAG: glycosyltransferase family 4 protein [bacterium]|nr:glycosyltransferase family 4 protein [bacterium]
MNWRDTTHPLAGGAEQYCWELAKRFAAAGATVTLFTARTPGLPSRCVRAAVLVRRQGKTYSVYLRAALFLLSHRRRFDAIFDCQNGIPFFSPLFLPDRSATIVLVIHHVHQDQFASRFRWPLRALGRILERDATRLIYRRRPIIAVSPYTRADVRRRLHLRGPVFVVPNGIASGPTDGSSRRNPRPTLIFVGRLVAHKRLQLLLHAVAQLRRGWGDVSLHVVGSGPEQPDLEDQVRRLGLDGAVTFWGRVPDEQRAALLESSWLLVNPSQGEGWGLTTIEANAAGCPALAFRVAGLVDSIVPGVNGWLVDTQSQLPDAIGTALSCLALPAERERFEVSCRAWAARFSWARSAERAADVVLASTGGRHRRATSDVATVLRLQIGDDLGPVRRWLGPPNLWSLDGSTLHILLPGQDALAAAASLEALGFAGHAEARVALVADLLLGPGPWSDDASRTAGRPPQPPRPPLESRSDHHQGVHA